MGSKRVAAYGGLLAVALAGAVAVVFLLPREEADSPPAGAGAAAVAREEAVAAAPPTLAGRGDERPLRTASLDELLAGVQEEEGADYEAAVAELRTRAAADADLVRLLLERLRGPWDWAVLNALVAIGAPAAVPLAECAVAADGQRRIAIFQALVRLGPEAASAAPLLHEQLLSSDDADLRYHVILVLGRIGPQAAVAVPTLLGLLEPPLDDDLADVAAPAVAQIAGATPEVLAALRAVILDEETLARPGAVAGVGLLGPAAASMVPLLLDLLEDPEDVTRLAAIRALGATADASRRVLDALVDRLEHDHMQGQQTAARALVALGDAGVGALVGAAERVEDIDARMNAARILMETPGQTIACADVLVSVLEEECDKGWKKRALTYLAMLDPPPPASRVLRALRTCLEDPTLAGEAIVAVACLEGAEAHAILVAALTGEDERGLGLKALDALLRRRGDDPRRDELLVRLLTPDAPRDLALGTLVRLGRLNPKGSASVLLPALEPWLAHEDVQLRCAAHAALARLGGNDAEMVRRLLDGLADAGLHAACATTLRTFPAYANRSVPALVDVLLALPEGAPQRFNVFWSTVTLAWGWPGARAWLEARGKDATDAERTRLDELLAKLRR